MTGLQFVASLTSTLIWPLVLFAVLLVFRKPLTDVLRNGRVQLKVAGQELLLEAHLDQAQQAVAEVAERSPIADSSLPDPDPRWTDCRALAATKPVEAIGRAWRTLEFELNMAQDRESPNVVSTPTRPGRVWTQWSAVAPAVTELQRLHELTSQGQAQPTPADAVRYIDLAQELAHAVRSYGTDHDGGDGGAA